MSLVVYLLITLTFAGASWLTRRRPDLAAVLGIGGLVVALAAAATIRPGDVASFGSVEVTATAYSRLFLLLGTAVALGLAIAGLALESRGHGAPVALATLGLGGLTLALSDPVAAILAGSTGGVLAALLTVARPGGRPAATAGIQGLRAVVLGGCMALAAVAWMGRDLSDLDAQPVVFGLAYLAVAIAVAIRLGAIPFHLWAARLTDVVSETGLPIVTVVAAAPFAIVGIGWVQGAIAPLLVDLGVERGIVLAVALGTIVLAAVAAVLQDDLEHLVGYSIVGDAGVALLGLVALGPGAGGAGLTWILALVVGRGAFAAWAAGLRHSQGTGRVPELAGWMVRAPLLAVAFGLIVVAAIGLPGFAAFEARGTLVAGAIQGPLGVVATLAVLAPVAYYGRLVSVGLAAPVRSRHEAEAWRPRIGPVDLTSAGSWWRETWERNRGFTGGIVALALGLLAMATSVGAFGGPDAAGEAARLAAERAVPSASLAPLEAPDANASDAPGTDPTNPPFGTD